jgi:hypothetical protein
MLQERDPRSGLRDVDALKELAASYGLEFVADHDMPAFNRLLIFAKEPVLPNWERPARETTLS